MKKKKPSKTTYDNVTLQIIFDPDTIMNIKSILKVKKSDFPPTLAECKCLAQEVHSAATQDKANR